MCEYEVQYRQRLEQERAQWNQYRESVEREIGELRRRLTEGQEEENLEDEMKKVGKLFFCVHDNFGKSHTHSISCLISKWCIFQFPSTANYFVPIRRSEFLMRTFQKSKGTGRCRKAAVGGHAHGAGDRSSQVQVGDCWGASKGAGGVQGEPLGRRQLTAISILFSLLFVQYICLMMFDYYYSFSADWIHPFPCRWKSSTMFWRQRSHVALTWRCTWPCWTHKSLSCRKMLKNFVKSYMMVPAFHLTSVQLFSSGVW